jgi:RimJ/RimL family protein N-acetyltransferase
MTIQLRDAMRDDVDRINRDEEDFARRGLIDHWSTQQHLEAIADESTAYWVILEDQEPAGHLIVQNLDDPNDSAFLRRIVVGRHRRGIGRAAVIQALKYLFGSKHMHRVWLNVKQGNSASAKFFCCLGFVQEGTSREASKISTGQYVSMDVYSMLADEFDRDL